MNEPGESVHASKRPGAVPDRPDPFFLDGNGRTSRLLSTLALYRAAYDVRRLFTISESHDRDRPAFYRAIQSVRERGMDLTGWLELFTEGLATQLDDGQRPG